MNAVTVKNLTKVFRQGDEDIYAVDHVSFTVAPGEMVAIVGQSGSGKTTLLNLIGGIEHPTSGSVEVDGVDVCSADDETLSGIRRRKLGYIFQDFNLIPILTAEENIIMPLLLDGKKPDKAKLRELAGFLGIENRLKHLRRTAQRYRWGLRRCRETSTSSRRPRRGSFRGSCAWRKAPWWEQRRYRTGTCARNWSTAGEA